MSNVFTKKWFYAAFVRSLKTTAQTAVATIGTAAVMGDVNWVMVASASALAGILSLLTSVAGLPEVQKVAVNTESVEDDDDGENDIEKGN